jgi:beta-glucosidase-like glycosyl hydrolase
MAASAATQAVSSSVSSDTTSATDTGISLRPLEIAVREAKVGSGMSACNHVKGEPTHISEETSRHAAGKLLTSNFSVR